MEYPGFWLIGLCAIMALILFLPFLSKWVEEKLELFLLVMGALAVTLSGRWSRHLFEEILQEPLGISLAVLIAGTIFRFFRPRIRGWIGGMVSKFGPVPIALFVVTGLGLLSSLITAIVAALMLSEIVTSLRLPRKIEIRVVVISCYSIGLGAALTPLGEPLSTIAIARLKGEPHQAGFFFLLDLLGVWVIPIVLALGIAAGVVCRGITQKGPSLKQDRPESFVDMFYRAFKVYLFVAALILLGSGFQPFVERFLIQVPPQILFWINIISAALDNATLTAAEIVPQMNLTTIRAILMGLLISGGMLIPGNIPNIICAGKLGISSREWAKEGLPLGMFLMTVIFIGLFLL